MTFTCKRLSVSPFSILYTQQRDGHDRRQEIEDNKKKYEGVMYFVQYPHMDMDWNAMAFLDGMR